MLFLFSNPSLSIFSTRKRAKENKLVELSDIDVVSRTVAQFGMINGGIFIII